MLLRVVVAMVSVSLVSMGTSHAAQPTKDTCIDDADEGQSLRDSGKLRDARTRFLSCTNAACPSAVAKDCSTWLADVEARMPTVILSAVDASGGDVADVRVLLDGQPFLDRLSGTQVPIDPGPHRLRYEYTAAAGTAPVEENVVIYERQKGRALQAKFLDLRARTAGSEPPLPPAFVHRKSSAPVAAYVVGGVGILALGSAAFFGLRGTSEYNDLEDTCGRTRTCPKSDIDSVKTKHTIADVSLAVGVVAIGVATVLFLTHPKETEERRTSSTLLNHTVLTPVRGGGWLAGYQTRF